MNRVLPHLLDLGALAIRRRTLCALLVLATWRGPMPIVHAHYVGDREGFTDGQLVRHLRIFHWRNEGAARIGWHFHIALPWHSSCGEDSEDPNPASDPLLAYGALTTQHDARDASVVHDGSWLLGWYPPVPEARESSAGCTLAAPVAGAFRNTLAAQVSRATLRAVTGVALC